VRRTQSARSISKSAYAHRTRKIVQGTSERKATRLAKETEPALAAPPIDTAERLGSELRFPDEAREQWVILDDVAVAVAVDTVSEVKKEEWQDKHRDAELEFDFF
jgi:hypothetical protein